MKTAAKYDRRILLKSLGAGLGLLPMLEAEWAKAACVPKAPRRFMTFVFTNGTTNSKFWPSGTGSTYVMNEVVAPLSPLRDKITFVDGLQFKNAIDSPFSVAGHHDYPAILTGVPLLEYSDPKAICVAGGPSIDQYIVDQIRLTKPQEPRPLVIGYRPGREPQTSWKGARAPESAQSDLYKLFTSLFVGATSKPLLPPEEMTKLRAARKSMLDLVGRDIERFCKNLGQDDRERCGSHLSSFRDIEKQFGVTEAPAVGGTACAPPTLQNAFDSNKLEDMGRYMEALGKLVAAAFASNITRVINFAFGDSVNDSISYPHLGLGQVKGVSIYEGGSHMDHGEAHANSAIHFQVRKWLYEQVAALLKGMDAVKEDGGRTLLDNSIVYVTTNMATGGGHDIGRGSSIPTFYAGSGGGYLKSGTAIKLPARVPHNRLFHAFANAMGVNPMGFDGGRYGGELKEVVA